MNRTTTLQRTLLAMAMLILTATTAMAWAPSEKYGRFIRTMHVDRAWEITTESHPTTGEGGNGNVDNGIHLVEYPGYIAWSIMIWDEHTVSTDDYQLDNTTVRLRNSSTGAEMVMAKVQFNTSDDDNTYFNYTVVQNDMVTYALTRRYYKDYHEGAVFAYFMTEYTDALRQFIEQAGSHLQVKVYARWDDGDWSDYTNTTDANMDDFTFINPPVPTVSDVVYTQENGVTGIRATLGNTGSMSEAHLYVEAEGKIAPVASRTYIRDGRYFLALPQLTKAQVDNDALSVFARSGKVYSYSTAHRNGTTTIRDTESSGSYTTHQPGSMTNVLPESARVKPTHVQLPLDGSFQVTDLGTGTVRVKWQTEAAKSGTDYDESNWILEFGTTADFSDAQTVSIGWSRTQTNYSKDFEIEREQGEKTFHARLHRASMGTSKPNLHAQCTMVTDYKVVTHLEVENLTNADGTPNGHIGLSWQLSDGIWPSTTRLQIAWGDGGNYQANRNETSYTVTGVPACTPTDFTLKVMDQGVAYSTQTYKDFVVPNTTPSLFLHNSVSKGYYNDHVDIRWTVDPNGANFTRFLIRRKQLGEADVNLITLHTETFRPGEYEYSYTDQTGLKGTYYEYTLEGWTECDSDVYIARSLTEVGFSQPYGVVSGQIVYSGNQGVAGATVSAVGNDSRSNRSLHLLGDSRVALPNDGSMLQAEQGTVEMFFMPDQTQTDYTLIRWPAGHIALTAPDSLFIPNRFNHLAWSWADGQYTLYVNGQPRINAAIEGQEGTTDSIFITGISGYIDELRFWSTAHDSAAIAGTCSRYLAGNEDGLTGYYRCDDQVPSELFDISRQGSRFNEHHGLTWGATVDPDHTPDSDQLSLKAITDEQGHYLINAIPYTADGSLYTVTPALGVHEFAPASKPLFFYESTSTHNGTDFTDQSSFSVRGAIYYEGTTIPVPGVKLKIDGSTYCTREGELITTDSKGEFEISVPIGHHFIVAEKDHHTFADGGRYPAGAGQTVLFEKPMENLRFTDNTTVLLVGRVAGGSKENAKPHGFGAGKANTGAAEIVLAMPNAQQSLNTAETQRDWLMPDSINCRSKAYTTGNSTGTSHRIVIRTDSATGEFAVALPPVDLSVTKVSLLSEPDYAFNDSYLRTLKLSERTGVVLTDSLEVGGTMRKFSYALAYDAIRTVNPTFIIRQGYDAGLGDRSILVKKADADTTITLYEQQTDGTIDYRMGYPVFHQQSYTWKMQVADIYTNLDGTRPVYDTIPWEKGKLTISNELDALGGGLAELDEEGRFTYTWDGGNPQLVAPYRMGMQLSVTDSLGQNPALWQGNTTWQAYMLGGKLEDGNDFVTMGPDKILYILRCPPGARSTATWKSGSTMHYVDNTWNHWNGHEELVTKTLAGAEAGTAVGGIAFYVISKLKATNTFTAGFQSDQTKTWNYINTTTTSIQTDLTTDRSSGLSGSNGDVYYGYSTNLLFGTCQKLNLEYDAEADNFSFSVKKAISMGDSITTTFQYSQYDIINNKIPNLKLLRKQCDMFQVPAADYDSATYANYSNHYIYITQLDLNDPLCYEPGNYLPVRPKLSNASTSDSLTMYNCAIKGWEDAIRKNEEAKVLAIRGGSAKYDENAMKQAARKLNLFGWLRSLFNGNTLTKHWVAADDIEDNSDILNGHYHLETEQDVEGRNYPTYYIYRTDFEAWKQENGIAGIDEDEVAKHHFYHGGYLLSNESVSGGAAPSKTFTTSHTQGSTTTFDYTCSGIIGDEFGLSINKTGVDVSIKTTQGGGHGSTDGSDSTLVSTIAYSLTSATAETYTVDVFQAPDNYGPIFYVRGGESYCPYEKPETTRYYEPGTPISQGTIQMQQPQITCNGQHHYTIADVPAGTAATLNVQLSNLADLENRAANMEFQLAVEPGTNPHGLDIRLDGRTIGFDSENFFLHCPESIDQTLTIQQTDRSVNEYNDVAILMRSVCQWNVICDTLWISVRFIPECTPLQLSAPSTTVSSLTGDTLDLTVSGFDRNYYGLADISLQRRHPTDTQWTTDTVVDASLIQSGTLHLRMPFTSSTWPDGLYEVRAVSHCTGDVDNSSNILEITKDMQRPTILGSPEPSNGYYTLDNDLAINWSEPIQYATLSKARNFRITGSLNAAEVDHDVALSLLNESRTEASLLINGTSFGAEMWLRTRSDGDILAFNGNACKASVENGMLKVETGNREGGNVFFSTASLPTDTWMYLYVCFEQNETSSVTAKAFYDDQTLTLLDHQPMPALSTNGNITVGGNMQGEVHDLKLWARARTAAEAQSQMHTTPDLYTAGLTAYWPLDEGIGSTAEERMRSRNLTLPDNAWYLAGANYAAAVAQSADIDITSANIAATDEYVLEYWARTDNASSLLAVANGPDTLRIGQQGQTLTLESPYTQRSYTAPYPTTLDGGIWHHYALSYIRNGYATLYIDGIAEMNVPQEAINGLCGQSIHLAPGAYDEIRLWRGRVDASLISGRRYDRCTGSESGLAWRFAFEKDEIDSGNQHRTVFTAQQTSGTEQVSINGAIAQDVSCPPLKAARTEEDVMFDFTSSADRTVFTLTSDANRIEGATLTCTASLIPDAAGNLSDPVSWQVKVNRSQLDWVGNTLSISTVQGFSAYAHLEIRNRSGIDDTWKITDLPSWLTFDQTEGTIDGMSISTIGVNTDESLAPGYYNATLTLTGRQGIKKTLDVSLHVQAQQPQWNVDGSLYDQTMSIIGQVRLPNGFANSADNILGVFSGNQCIGTAHPQYFANYGTFFTMITVYGNRLSNGTLTFRFWDSTSGRVFSPLTTEIDNEATHITFQDGQVVGSLLSPVIFRCDADNIQQTVSAEEGWNWLSFYVQPASTAFADILQPVLSQLVQIKNPYGYSVPDGDKLSGNVLNMMPEYMYKTRFSAPVSFQLEGSQYISTEHPITIHSEWNWIGFMSTTNLSVKEALSMYSPVVGDVIKSRTSFAIWDGTDWVGTLRYLVPGSGYMYKSAREYETVLFYPSAGASHAPRRVAAAQAEHYKPDVNGRYPTTMSVLAQVRDGNEAVSGYELGAFVGSECRGATAPDGNLLFLSLEGEAGETITFRLYNSATGEEILAHETLDYAADTLVGSISEPFILQIGQADGLIEVGTDDGRSNANVYKVIRDGRVFIIREGEWYDVLGRKNDEVNE